MLGYISDELANAIKNIYSLLISYFISFTFGNFIIDLLNERHSYRVHFSHYFPNSIFYIYCKC